MWFFHRALGAAHGVQETRAQAAPLPVLRFPSSPSLKAPWLSLLFASCALARACESRFLMSLYLPLLTIVAAQTMAARTPDLAISLLEVVMLVNIANRSMTSSGGATCFFLSLLSADFPLVCWLAAVFLACSTASRITCVKKAVRSTRCARSHSSKASRSC